MSEEQKNERAAWMGGKCRVPMWMGGGPAGFCDKEAFGPQYPREYLSEINGRYLFDRPAYCLGPCCKDHGGPGESDVVIYQDGYTKDGRRMWCAVMPDFVNLQESPAGFSGDARVAVKLLHKTIARVEGRS